MAASYQTGTASSASNLLQTIVTWLVAQGWTQDASAAEGTGWRAHLHKGAMYVNLRAAGNENIWPDIGGGGNFHDQGAGGYGIGLYLGTAYNAGNDWDKQTGGPLRSDGSTIGAGMNLPSGAISAYHLFDDGNDNVTIVVERSPGIFCHMGFGVMVDLGHPEDFWFFHGSSSAFQNTIATDPGGNRGGINITAWPPMSAGDIDAPSRGAGGLGSHIHSQGFIRVDAATWTSRWMGDGNFQHQEFGWTGRWLRDALHAAPGEVGLAGEDDIPGYQYLIGRTFQSAFVAALALPLLAYAETSAGRYPPAGYLPTVFWSEAFGNGYSAGDVYPIGGLDYMVFPGFLVRKAA